MILYPDSDQKLAVRLAVRQAINDLPCKLKEVVDLVMEQLEAGEKINLHSIKKKLNNRPYGTLHGQFAKALFVLRIRLEESMNRQDQFD